MAWTYDSTAPGSSDKSWVRMRIGDTSSGDQLLQDEEILAILSVEGDRTVSAAVAAESIGARFARQVDKTVGKLSISMAQASQGYFGLAKRLRSEISLSGAPYAGGISVSDKAVDTSDTDRVAPAFYTGQFEVVRNTESS